jgi:hypothetical protein
VRLVALLPFGSAGAATLLLLLLLLVGALLLLLLTRVPAGRVRVD